MKTEFEDIFGLKIATGTREELLSASEELLLRGGIITTVNPEMLDTARRDPELYSVIAESLAIPDGIGVSALITLFGKRCARLPGIELAEELLEKQIVKLAIIGGRAGIARAALENLTARHRNVIPTLALDGYNHSYNYIKERILEERPTLVFLCLGSPRQELLCRELYESYRGALYIGLGGSADVWSGEKKRAPMPVRVCGGEWIYRAICEPRRIGRLPKAVSFAAFALKYRLNRQKFGRKTPKSY